jgi:hypothetical protein
MLRRKATRINGLELGLQALEATQSHPKATPKPPQSQLIANRLRPESHLKATLKPLQSHPKATPKLPQSDSKATPKPRSSQPVRPFQDPRGAETTCIASALTVMRIGVLRPSVAIWTLFAPDGLTRFGGEEAYARAKFRLFRIQHALYWASVQGEALARLRELSLAVLVKVIDFRHRPSAVEACQTAVPGERRWRANSCRTGSFYSLHRRGFAGRSSGRSGEKCDFRRRSFACTGSFGLGSDSKPSTSR